MKEKTYQNPVFPYECADPFVIAHNGAFWCYRTGHWQDGKIFGILRSEDLVHWEPISGALDPLPDRPPYYWAPEVVYENGIFYLYYSTGNEVHMHLRVATCEKPEGPFIDSDRRLTQEVFAIDAHVFVDEDGSRYMFYATDFLERDRVGTGTVMDRMIDPYTLEGKPWPVSLAKFDWQIYDPRRAEKNNLRWHTIEGSFVLKRKGRYYQMFSGGNYQNKSYGVGYAVTSDLNDRTEWSQHIDGETVYPIMRTVPDKVIGPGHNSVVIGPDHRQFYCIYHIIKPQLSFERILAVDRLEWIGDHLVVLGPSYTPQPFPNRAQPLANLPHLVHQPWQALSSGFIQPQVATTTLPFRLEFPAGLFQTWVRQLPGEGAHGKLGIDLQGSDESRLRFSLDLQTRHIQIQQTGKPDQARPLPSSFREEVLHLWKIDIQHQHITFLLDAIDFTWHGAFPVQMRTLALWTEGAAAEFNAAEITYGSEDLFDVPQLSLEALGWIDQQDGGSWQILDHQLVGKGGTSQATRLYKALSFENYEWVVNFRLIRGDGLRFYPDAALTQADGLHLEVEQGIWVLRGGSIGTIQLPSGFDGYAFQQFRFRKQAGQIWLTWLDLELGSWSTSPGETSIGLGVGPGAAAAFDMVRLTQLL